MGLTPGALVFAVLCVLWTGATAFVAGAVGWLYTRTRRQIDFISLLSYVVVVAMLASMAQQLYTIARWDEVKKRERQDSILEAGKTNFFDVGSDRVVKAMYYIQILCYNIGGTLIAFWCFFLWANVWPLQSSWWNSTIYATTTKSLAVAVACVLTGVSQIDYFADKHLARFMIGNILLITVLAVAPVFLVLILYRYVYYRRLASQAAQGQLRGSWTIHEIDRFPKEGGRRTSDGSGSEAGVTGLSLELKRVGKPKGSHNSDPTDFTTTRRKTLGTMLMIRFVVAIVVMSGLEIFHICFQLSRVIRYGENIDPIKEIPLTTGAQIGDTYMFLPATSQGWLILLVFGTTENYWSKFKTLVGKIFCCNNAFRKFNLKHRTQSSGVRQEQSAENIFQCWNTLEQGQPGLANEGEVEARNTGISTINRRQSLDIFQCENISRHEQRSNGSLCESMSEELPAPRAAHMSHQVWSATTQHEHWNRSGL